MRYILLIITLAAVSGCLSFDTPELKSPCVAVDAIETGEDIIVNPCVRRPANVFLG
jgi:uncharacterized protein DUF2706